MVVMFDCEKWIWVCGIKNDATKMGAKGRGRRMVWVQRWTIWLQGAKKKPIIWLHATKLSVD